jgi:Flp pilus assembly pilin Flp
MRAILNRVRRFWPAEEGPTTTEYAVMLALVIVASLVTIYALGVNVRDIFQFINDEMAAVQPA